MDVVNASTVKASYYFITAMGFVTALSWNNAVRSAINKYYPLTEDSIEAMFIYALVITILFVLIIMMLPDTTSELPKQVQERIKNLESAKSGRETFVKPLDLGYM